MELDSLVGFITMNRLSTSAAVKSQASSSFCSLFSSTPAETRAVVVTLSMKVFSRPLRTAT